MYSSSSSYSSQNMNIEIKSYTETIKPSSPTPPHLSQFKLSLIDNYTPPLYVPFLFFYNPPPPPPLPSKTILLVDILKSSLAHALTRFYPFAGRLSKSTNDDLYAIPIVHCNDQGIPFSVATTVGSSLASFLCRRAPEIDSFHHFLPFRPFLIGTTPQGIESAPQIAVRVTVFACGGVAIGICLLHKIIDAQTFADFMKLWAAIARGDGKQVDGGAYAHDRAATSLFPAHPTDVGPSTVDYVSEEEKKKSVIRRFVFDEEAISALKLKARSEWVSNPTRSEAISALVWKCAVSSTARALSPKAGSVHSVGVMAMGLRSRIKELAWGDYAVGNLVWGPISLYEYDEKSKKLVADDDDDETKTTTLQVLVHELRKTIKTVDKELIHKLVEEGGGGGRQEYLRNEELRLKALTSSSTAAAPDEVAMMMYFAMSSLMRMELYKEADFGWGKPMWIGFTNFAEQVNNALIIMDSPGPGTGNGGVEAWIVMHEQEMSMLENDPHLLAYAKINPPIVPSSALSPRL